MTRNELFEQIADRIVEDFLTEHIDTDKIDHEEFTAEIAEIIDTQMSGYDICKGVVSTLE